LKDKHTNIEADNRLLRVIHQTVNKELKIDERRFTSFIMVKFVFYVFLSAASYIGLYYIVSPQLFVFCFIAFGFSILLFAFNFAHDLSHGTIFKNTKANDYGFVLIYALNGAHAEAWKKRHLESHHFAPNVEHYDSDLEISSLIRVLPQSPVHWYHRYQHLYAPLAYTCYSLYWVLIKDFYLFFKSKGKSLSYIISFICQKTFYFIYLLGMPLLFSVHPWYIVLLGFIAMHLSQSLFLLFTFFMTHHVEGVEYPGVDKDGYIQTSWVMNQIKSSNDMYPFSTAANFIFGGFNNHIAHHLFPHIHHLHYPQLSRIIYRVLEENGITPNHTTYAGGIWSHLKLLKAMAITTAEDRSASVT